MREVWDEAWKIFLLNRFPFVLGMFTTTILIILSGELAKRIVKKTRPVYIWYKIQQYCGTNPKWDDCLLKGRQCKIEALPEAFFILKTNQEYKTSDRLRIVKVTEEVIHDCGEKGRQGRA